MSKRKARPVQEISDVEVSYRRTFNSTEGQMVLNDLKNVLHYGKTIYRHGASMTDNAFEQGMQEAINRIVFILEKDSN